MGAELSDGRAALPLPACGERSEFARSSRKFRVRGPLQESELRGKAPSLSASPPLWRGPLTPTLSPQAGRGSRKARTQPYLCAYGDKPGHDGAEIFQHDRDPLQYF